MVSSLKITSWNANSLRVNSRRRKILQFLRLSDSDIILLQETHLPREEWLEILARNRWITRLVCTNQSCNVKGVAVLNKKSAQARMEGSMIDSRGRWAISYVKIHNIGYAFVAYYGPNIDDPSPLRELYQQLLETKYIILGGDFNTLLDPVLDKSTPRPAVNSPKNGGFCSLSDKKCSCGGYLGNESRTGERVYFSEQKAGPLFQN